MCFAEAPGGAQESVAWFVSPEELHGIHLPTDEEQAANEARAKAATDCVAFIREIHAEFGLGRDRGLLYPGDPPTVPAEAYWFGLDSTSAALPTRTHRRRSTSMRTMKVKLLLYTVMYQRPEDGCHGQALNISSDEVLGFGVGHENPASQHARGLPERPALPQPP